MNIPQAGSYLILEQYLQGSLTNVIENSLTLNRSHRLTDSDSSSQPSLYHERAEKRCNDNQENHAHLVMVMTLTVLSSY